MINNNSPCLPDTSRPPSNLPNSTTLGDPRTQRGPNANEPNNRHAPINTIRAIERSEFPRDLCYDVEQNDGLIDGQNDSRVVSPYVRAEACSRTVNILLDSGSEITCISESFYNSIKNNNNNDILELPVSNLSVYVAVGRKTIQITKKYTLVLKFGNSS